MPVYRDVVPVLREVAKLVARERPHIIGLQEVPLRHPWHKGGDGKPQDAAALLPGILAKAGWRFRSWEVQPYYGTKKLGLMVLSRYRRMRGYQVRPHVRRDRSPVQTFEVRTKRQRFQVYNYHGNVRAPRWALRGLRQFVAKTLPKGQAAVILGDFNIQNRLRSRYAWLSPMGRDFVDACEERGGGPCKETVNTSIHRHGGGVDYIWVSKGVKKGYAKAWRVASVRSVPEINDRLAISDHLPVVARVETTPRA